jgi:pimeloyl-ACP methyl ester carboxylesterase
MAKATGTEFDIQTPSGRIHAARYGAADAAVAICVPGLSANLRSHDFVAERIAGDDLQVVAIDLRGRGKSEISAPGTYGWANHAKDVFAVADAVGAERFSIIGHSMGGFVALAATELDAARIERTVLIDIAGAPDASAVGPIAMSVNRLGTVYPSTEFYVEAVKKLGLIDPWSEYWDRYFLYELESVEDGVRSRSDKDAVLEDSAYGASHDPYALWPMLTMPVLLVYAQREIMPGMGHIVCAADRERFTREVPTATVADVDANHYTVATSDGTVAAIRSFFGLA